MLLIGKRFTKSDPTNVGGVIVLFEQLVKDLGEIKRKFTLIDLNKRNYSNSIVAYFTVVIKLILWIPYHKKIFFNGTSKDYYLFAPIVVFLSKLFKKKVILRKFGGTFHLYFEELGYIKKTLVKYALTNADILFFETKYLVDYFCTFNESTYWFPNVRERKIEIDTRPVFSKKFVFISHVKKEKGISELLSAINQLPAEYTIHIYGPIINYDCPKELEKTFNISYKGSIPNEKVLSTLNKYDVLILPTFWKSEGYPGIIIEAFSLGMPVIATNLIGIMEMVKDGNNGYLVAPKSTDELKDKILKINEKNYKDLSLNALTSFSNFDASKQIIRIISIIDGD